MPDTFPLSLSFSLFKRHKKNETKLKQPNYTVELEAILILAHSGRSAESNLCVGEFSFYYFNHVLIEN